MGRRGGGRRSSPWRSSRCPRVATRPTRRRVCRPNGSRSTTSTTWERSDCRATRSACRTRTTPSGTLGYNPANHSLFIAGHAQHNAVAEFAIPPTLGDSAGDVVEDLPVVETPLQPFVAFLDDAPTGNPDGIDRIDGLFVDGDNLIVNAERWYDAAGTPTTRRSSSTPPISTASRAGTSSSTAACTAAGYMSAVPSEWRSALGGPLLTGWASNTSIISRHSVGPTLFTVDPSDLYAGDPLVDPSIATQVHMDFPYQGQRWLTSDALDSGPTPASPLWNFLAEGPRRLHRTGHVDVRRARRDRRHPQRHRLQDHAGRRQRVRRLLRVRRRRLRQRVLALRRARHPRRRRRPPAAPVLVRNLVGPVRRRRVAPRSSAARSIRPTRRCISHWRTPARSVRTTGPPLILAYSVPSTSTFVIERGARATEKAVRLD